MSSHRNHHTTPINVATVKAREVCAKRAFSLVELMVVVSIIALLLAILVPALSRSRAMGKSVRCLTNLRDCGQAVVVFTGAHGGRMQIATDEIGLQAADPNRRKYAYDRNKEYKGELLCWPVAFAKVSGMDINSNMEWGIREVSFTEALKYRRDVHAKSQYSSVACPGDSIQLSTPFYPRQKGSDNNGLRSGDSGEGTSYWGMLSYALNEDIAGAEVSESGGNPACWRAVETPSGWVSCRGEMDYATGTPCGQGGGSGYRLRGVLEKAHEPATVGLIFEGGPDSEIVYPHHPADHAYSINSAQAEGPFLGDFQQRSGTVMPNSRHPDGRLSILFVDTHAEAVRPVEYKEVTVDDYVLKIPSRYSPRVRVSPYRARDMTGP